MASPTLGVRTWTTAVNETVWACGCRALTNVTPNALITWCGQPDCLRLFAAQVAYTQRQFDWQTAHGGTPTMVAALLRPMVTPLPQILPPPPASGGQYFKGEAMSTQMKEHEGKPGDPAHPDEEKQHPGERKPPGPEPHRPPDRPGDKPGDKPQQPGQRR